MSELGLRAALVAVGDELLSGDTVDTNGAWLGERLAGLGIPVAHRQLVGDDPEAIVAAVRTAVSAAEAVLVSGGLGPTPDDLTREAVAEALGLTLVRDPEVEAGLEARFRAFRRGPLPESNRKQADVLTGATLLPNPVGTAPAQAVSLSGPGAGILVLLPGVPRELKRVFDESVASLFRARFGDGLRPRISRTLHTTGIAESALADRVAALRPSLGPVSLAFLPDVTGVDLRLTVRGVRDGAEAKAFLDRAEAALEPAVGSVRFPGPDLALALGTALVERGLTVAVAESCTGGLVGARLTELAGSSAWFQGGVIAYSNEAKVDLLGVDAALLERHGAVSAEVAVAMAAGARHQLGADTAIAVTGIAGPEGGTDDKPVGTVWVAVALPGEEAHLGLRLPGDRAGVRARSAQAGLNLLYRTLLGGSLSPPPYNP